MTLATEEQGAALQEAQDEVLDSYNTVVDRWCERRGESIAAFTGLSNAVTKARSPMEFGTAFLRWYQGSLHRLSQDAHDQLEMGLTLMAHSFGPRNGAVPDHGSQDVDRAGQRGNGNALVS